MSVASHFACNNRVIKNVIQSNTVIRTWDAAVDAACFSIHWIFKYVGFLKYGCAPLILMPSRAAQEYIGLTNKHMVVHPRFAWRAPCSNTVFFILFFSSLVVVLSVPCFHVLYMFFSFIVSYYVLFFVCPSSFFCVFFSYVPFLMSCFRFHYLLCVCCRFPYILYVIY